MVMPFDTTFSEYNAERLRAADTLLLGRRTFEGFRGYWPSIVDDSNSPPVEREISRLNNAIDKVVVSDSLTDEDLAPWTNTRIVRRADAHDAIAALKAGGRPRDPHVRQPRAVERPADHRPGRRAASHDRLGLPRRRHTGIQRRAHRLRLLDVRRLDDSQLILARYAAAGW